MVKRIAAKILSKEISKKVGYYVYALIDPRYHEVFYIGKGKGNRGRKHILSAFKDKNQETDNAKLKRIQEISETKDRNGNNYEVEIYVILGGRDRPLEEGVAFAIEASFLKLRDLKFRLDLKNSQTGNDRNYICWENINDVEKKINKKLKRPG